jgi:hypothetical protein
MKELLEEFFDLIKTHKDLTMDELVGAVAALRLHVEMGFVHVVRTHQEQEEKNDQ